jgi:hypothetical protein
MILYAHWLMSSNKWTYILRYFVKLKYLYPKRVVA